MTNLCQFIWKTTHVWLLQLNNSHSLEITKIFFVFQENETYNTRIGNHLARRNIWTTQIGIKSVSNLGAKIYFPGEIKNSSYFSLFKRRIIKWISKSVFPGLSEIYIKNQLYLIFLRRFLASLLYFNLKLKSFLESWKMKSVHTGKMI